MEQLTGSNLPSNVSSLSSKMLIVFDTDYVTNMKGFKATIVSTEKSSTANNSAKCTVSNPCNINEGHCYYDGQCIGSLRCGNNNCLQEAGYVNGTNCCYNYCDQFLDMANGTLDYYQPHGKNHRDMDECTWFIHVVTNMTITLEFTALLVCK